MQIQIGPAKRASTANRASPAHVDSPLVENADTLENAQKMRKNLRIRKFLSCDNLVPRARDPLGRGTKGSGIIHLFSPQILEIRYYCSCAKFLLFTFYIMRFTL